jgi:hypothetical protein
VKAIISGNGKFWIKKNECANFFKIRRVTASEIKLKLSWKV